MAKDITVCIDQIFDSPEFVTYVTTGDKTALKHHLKVLVKCIHEAYQKQSAAVYGCNKYSTQQLIKAALMEQKQPQVEFELRPFGKPIQL